MSIMKTSILHNQLTELFLWFHEQGELNNLFFMKNNQRVTISRTFLEL